MFHLKKVNARRWPIWQVNCYSQDWFQFESYPERLLRQRRPTGKCPALSPTITTSCMANHSRSVARSLITFGPSVDLTYEYAAAQKMIPISTPAAIRNQRA